MSDYSSLPDEEPIQFDPAKAKAKREQDAEKIRQDFIKSQRLPSGAPATQKPIPSPDEDEC